MRDYEEKSYYEIQLDNKQLILVFLAGVTVCVLIFILGVMVGKGKKEAEIAAASKSEMNAGKVEPDTSTPEEPRQAVDSERKGEKAGKKGKKQKAQDEGYTFYDLDKPETEEATLKKESEKEPKKEPEKETEKADASEPSQTTTPSANPDSAVETSEGLDSNRYTVQVMATASKEKADQQLTYLKSKGYTAFLDEDKTNTGSVYKVRVGKFDNPDSAKKIASRLKQDLKLETWVAVLD